VRVGVLTILKPDRVLPPDTLQEAIAGLPHQTVASVMDPQAEAAAEAAAEAVAGAVPVPAAAVPGLLEGVLPVHHPADTVAAAVAVEPSHADTGYIGLHFNQIPLWRHSGQCPQHTLVMRY